MSKKILTGLAAVGLLTTYTTTAMASSGFEITVNSQLGNGASVSCNACHNGGTSAATATFPMANTYRAARTAGDFTLVATSDSDGDGYINKFEVNATATEFNDAAISPFTKVVAANGDANVKALADASAASATFTDSQGLATGKEILGGIKVTLNQADTIYFKAGGVSATDTIYTVDAAGVGTLVAAADWAATADGGLQIKALPAGVTTADYVAVRAVPVAVSAAAVTNGTASVTGCVSSSLSTPLMMVLGLLSLGFFVRRKKLKE